MLDFSLTLPAEKKDPSLRLAVGRSTREWTGLVLYVAVPQWRCRVDTSLRRL